MLTIHNSSARERESSAAVKSYQSDRSVPGTRGEVPSDISLPFPYYRFALHPTSNLVYMWSIYLLVIVM